MQAFAAMRSSQGRKGPRRLAEISPGGDEGLLGSVLRRLPLAQLAQAEVEDQALMLEDKLVEGVEVAVRGHAVVVFLRQPPCDSNCGSAQCQIRGEGSCLLRVTRPVPIYAFLK